MTLLAVQLQLTCPLISTGGYAFFVVTGDTILDTRDHREITMRQPKKKFRKLTEIAPGKDRDRPDEFVAPIAEMPDRLARAVDWDEMPAVALETESKWDCQ